MRLRTVLLAAATLAYPIVTYLLLRSFGVHALAIPLGLFGVLRILLERKWGWGGMLLLLAAATLLTDRSLPAKLYPVAVNFTLLVVFGHSLHRPPSIVERLARVREPTLPPAAVAYTRRVTMVWCGYFFLNGCIAALLALYGSDQAWVLYCGGIAYLLAGTLFAVELLIRLRMRRRWAHV